jgi:dihydroflavonol-4-reductase
VSGGAGFIGGHVVRLLLERNRHVRILDLQAPKGPASRAEFVPGSILNRPLVREAMRGIDHVFHLAANPNLWAPDKRMFHSVNYEGTKVMLEEAERAGVTRFVYTSTESILKGRRRGGTSSVGEEVERTLDDMPGPYCRSKFLAEQAAFAAVQRGLPVVIVNPTLPIGPGDHRITPPTQMLIDFIHGDNPAYLDFDMNLIDVRDAALGHLLAAEHGRPGERYILGGENIRLAAVLEILRDLTGFPMPRLRIPYALALTVSAVSEFFADTITHAPPRASLTGVRIAGASMVFDCTKAVRELGLPQSPVDRALAEGLDWLWMEGHIRRPLNDRRRAFLRSYRHFTAISATPCAAELPLSSGAAA